MNQALKTLLALFVAAIVMLAIRAYVFTIYTVPVNVDIHIHKGDRVGVLHWLCSDIERGDVVVFGDSIKQIGKIKAVPGDSVVVNGEKYLIPHQCCHRCKSTDCHTYLLLVRQRCSCRNTICLARHGDFIDAWSLYLLIYFP